MARRFRPVSVKIPSVALLAISASAFLHAASPGSTRMAVYYSFQSSSPAAVVTEMQAELDRILSPMGLNVAWRDLAAHRDAEDFQQLVVFQFHGHCSFDRELAPNDSVEDPSGQALARTELTNGRVLPFGVVDCDRLRRFIAPALKPFSPEARNAALGRAIARVSAHEIYHMLTQSEAHGAEGIARSSHSRANLTGPMFAFGPKETDQLRSRLAASIDPAAETSIESSISGTDTPLAGSPAGR